MADAALAIARRILAGPGGAPAAADSLRTAAASDAAAAGDARLWAAVAYLCSEAGDTEGATEARCVIARLRTPVQPSPVRSLDPVLEEQGSSPHPRTRADGKDAEQDVADRVARRITDSSARMSALREAARGLFANVAPQSQRPVRRERGTDGVARLIRHMGVLRARGRNIVTAVREDEQTGGRVSSRFEEAAKLSEDGEDTKDEEDDEEDGDDEESDEDDEDDEEDTDSDDDANDPGWDSGSSERCNLRSGPSEEGDSEEDEGNLDGDSSFDEFDVPCFTSDDGMFYARRMTNFVNDWTSSSSSSSSEVERLDFDCLGECDSIPGPAHIGKPECDIGTELCEPLNTEPLCFATFSAHSSDGEVDSVDTDNSNALPCSPVRRSFWNRPLVRINPSRNASGGAVEHGRSSLFAEPIASRPTAPAESARNAYAYSPTTPQEASDEDPRGPGPAASGPSVEFTTPHGMSFFHDEPLRASSPRPRFPVPVSNIVNPLRITNRPRPGRGRGPEPELQSPARHVSGAPAEANRPRFVGAPAAVSSNSALPHAHRALTTRSRRQRITAPDPESSDSSGSDFCLSEMRRVRRRLRIFALGNDTANHAHLSQTRARRHVNSARERNEERNRGRAPAIRRYRRVFFTDNDSEHNETVASRTGTDQAPEFHEEQRDEVERMLDEIYEDEMQRFDSTFGLVESPNPDREPQQCPRNTNGHFFCSTTRPTEGEEREQSEDEGVIAGANVAMGRREEATVGEQGHNRGGVSEVDVAHAREFLEDDERGNDETCSLGLVVDEGNGEESSNCDLEDFDTDDVVLHRYYLSNALSALHGGVDDEDDCIVDVLDEVDDSESDDDVSDCPPSSPPQLTLGLRRNSSFLCNFSGSEYEDDVSPEDSVTVIASADGSIGGSDVEGGELSDGNSSGAGADFHLAVQLSRVESRFTRAQQRVARNRERTGETDGAVSGDDEVVHRLGPVVEDGDDGDTGSDWVPVHGHWWLSSQRWTEPHTGLRDDDEEEVIFYGETRTATEMEAIAPGHTAAPELRSNICVICTEELGTEVVRTLPCAEHRYHKKCIDSWCEQNATCPTCRAELKMPTVGSATGGGSGGGESSRHAVTAARRFLSRGHVESDRGQSSTEN